MSLAKVVINCNANVNLPATTWKTPRQHFKFQRPPKYENFNAKPHLLACDKFPLWCSSLQFFKCYRLTCLVLVFFSGRIMCDPSRKSIFLKNGSANKQSYWETTLVISFRTEVWTSCHLHTTYKGITREPNINSLLDTCLSSYLQDTKVNRGIQYWSPLNLNISRIIPKSRIS